MRDNMKRRELKRKEKNRILRLKLTEGNIDDVYKSLPKIVKVCNKKYKIELFYNNDFVFTKCFFTNRQKDILQFSYWTPKELIIEKLVKSFRRFLKV